MVVTATERGRQLLEDARRAGQAEHRQVFYAGITKTRELAHDARVHIAYLASAERLTRDGGRIRRVVLEGELKRDYQSFLQAPNRGRPDSSGRPERNAVEIARWAQEHDLPIVGGHVQFPDLRIEYEDRDGQRQVEDVEVMTPNYRGAHASAKVKAGFTRYRTAGSHLAGRTAGSRTGRGRDDRLAEEMLP